jgi:hypothetical protein
LMVSGAFMIGVPFCFEWRRLRPADREFAGAAHLGRVV